MQLLADPAGRLIWASPALPGSTHDLTAARRHGLIATLTSAAIATFADKGYLGAGGAVGPPYRGRGLVGYRKTFNRDHATIRGVGERAIATLKTWRVQAKVRCSPHRISQRDPYPDAMETERSGRRLLQIARLFDHCQRRRARNLLRGLAEGFPVKNLLDDR